MLLMRYRNRERALKTLESSALANENAETKATCMGGFAERSDPPFPHRYLHVPEGNVATWDRRL